MNDIITNNTSLKEYQNQAQALFLENNSKFRTYTGRDIDILNFSVNDVDIEDIANGLSNICRYGGQCNEFYSVAEHSVLTSRLIESLEFDKEFVKSGLMHDASEAYLVDVPTPLKILCPGYQMIENSFERAIYQYFNLKYTFTNHVIRECDYRLYLKEREILMPGYADRRPLGILNFLRKKIGFLPKDQIRNLSPKKAKKEFLKRVKELDIKPREIYR